MSLKTKFLLATITGNFLVLTILSGTIIYLEVTRMQKVQKRKAQFAARTLQDWIKKSEDLFHLPEESGNNEQHYRQKLRVQLATSNRFRNWYVLDPDNRIVLSYDNSSSLSERELALVQQARERRNVVMSNQHRVYFPVIRRDGRMYVVATNLEDFTSPRTGLFRIVISTAIIMGLGTILLVLVMYLIYDHLLFNPLSKLVRATEKIAEKEYSFRIDEPDRNDEIGRLVEAFHQMMDELESFHQNLQEKVENTKEKMKRTERNLVIAQRLTSMGTLASGIAHEINNPLGGMLNAVRSLKDPELSRKKQKEYLDIIDDGLERIQEIVQKVLDFSPNKDDVEIKELDLRDTIESVVNLEKHRIDRRNITVTTDLPDTPAQIHGGSVEIQQALFNVLKNAVDAVSEKDSGEEGQIHISLTPHDGETYRIEIEDNGPGMSEACESQAFDPFYTTKQDQKGSGLGLSISHNIIQNHGGSIEIDSVPGEGTTVRVFLPRNQNGTSENETNVNHGNF